MKYVVKSKDNLYEEYILFVAETIHFIDDDVEFGVSMTDEVGLATKFLFCGEAKGAMEMCSLHEDDWEVVGIEG